MIGSHGGRSRAIFLDKDDTLVPNIPYNADPERMHLLPGVAEGLVAFAKASYRLIVVTNQAGVARGYFTENALRAVEGRLRKLMKSVGVTLDGFYYCPHHPDGTVPQYSMACTCRKPEPGLILQAARDHMIDLARSWFIGDRLHDVEAGRRAGCRTILVGAAARAQPTLDEDGPPFHRVTTLAEASRIVVPSREALQQACEDLVRTGAVR